MTQIDPAKEKLVTLSQLASEISRTRWTVWRLIRHGTVGLSGSVVRLESVQTQAGLMTTREAYQRFLAKLNKVDSNDEHIPGH